jgi:hypothetical protein
VPESRLLKFNDANLQRQKELQASYSGTSATASKKKADEGNAPSGGNTTPTNNVPVGGRKRARDITVDKVCHISL